MMAPYFSASAAELVHWADVAVHGEDAVRDHQLVSGLVGDFLQQLLAVIGILVPEDLDLRPRQPRAIDDAGVVQLVGENEIFLAEDRAHGARIGREPTLEDDARLDIFEASNLLLKFHMDAHRSGNGAHRTRANAEFLRGFQRCFNQLGMIREAEVIVAGQVDDLAPVVVAHRGLLVIKDPQFEMRSLRP